MTQTVEIIAKSHARAARLPRQIAYIIGNEGCERFSFYGMRNILTQFLVSSTLLFAATEVVPQAEREGAAKEVFHTFVLGVYFFPLLGGWLADRFLGKYRTTLYLSLVYCVGHACLATFEGNKAGFFTGLFLIALGSGGIKPCVAAFVGDQFDQSNKSLAKVVFDAFYWIINFGSFFASLLMPVFLREFGPAVAFTATVAATSPGAGTPTGSVTFRDGASTLAVSPLSGGSATLTTAGSQSLTAQDTAAGVGGSQAGISIIPGPLSALMRRPARSSRHLPMRTRSRVVAASAPPARRSTALMRASSARDSYGLAM